MNQSTLQQMWARFLTFVIAGACIQAVGAQVMADRVSQFGITWIFDGEYEVGQFVNGDWWVVGPVTIVEIDPASTTEDGVTMNGSMVDPVVNSPQGYDSRIRNNSYSSSLNVAQNLPATLDPVSSLMSSISYETAVTGDNPQLRTIAILTVVAESMEGTFRPPYVAGDKPLRWRETDLDYSKLGRVPIPPNAPSLAVVAKSFERPWIEQRTNWTGRYMHPGENQPAYGREMAHQLAEGLLSLQMDYRPTARRLLLIRMVQYGIDVFGAAKAGVQWGADGGHNQGRKMPMLLAAVVLDDEQMLEYSDAEKHFIFQEDQQTWYVRESDVGRPLYTGDGRPREEYLPEDVGIPEWGEKHNSQPNRDGRNWNTAYRTVSGSCTLGHILTARIMGLQSKWNWPAVFDYYESRYWPTERLQSGTSPNRIQPYVRTLWELFETADSQERPSQSKNLKIVGEH